jgi:hypothetical protein
VGVDGRSRLYVVSSVVVVKAVSQQMVQRATITRNLIIWMGGLTSMLSLSKNSLDGQIDHCVKLASLIMACVKW